MKIRIIAFSILVSFLCLGAFSQSIQVLDSGTNTSLRGLSVVNDKVIWVSGSNGKVGRSVNKGKDWQWITITGYEKRDFRDIEAFNSSTAVIIAVAEPAVILRTSDGGKTWNQVYLNNTRGMFLDAMEFWNEESGIVIGDPIDGRFFITRTFDGGKTWTDIPFENRPIADSGEACFAASGTNIRSLARDQACFVSNKRFYFKEKAVDLPLIKGKESMGANSVAVRNYKKKKGNQDLFVVGGDFSDDKVSLNNSARSQDGGKTWINPATPPAGYRSCVEYISARKLITCGTSGVDISEDGGDNWKLISDSGFHVARKAKKGKSVFFAGSKGRIAKLEL